jgi:hypothetical protein
MSNRNNFSSKIIELSSKILPNIKNKEVRIASLTDEKPGTIKNWLFKNALPPEKKKLKVADRMGVSKEYLYSEDSIPKPPVAIYDPEMNAFIIPVISEANLSNIAFRDTPTLVIERYILSIKKTIKDKIKLVESTYCFEVKTLTFPPFIFEGDIVVFNQSFYGVNDFSLFINQKKIEIVRVGHDDNAYTNKEGVDLKAGNNTLILPIILIINDGVKR